MRLPKIVPAALLGIAALFTVGCVTQGTALLAAQYSVQVDYSRSVEDSLRAGQYNWAHYQVTSSNFPGPETGRGALSVVLVPFSPQANLDSVLGGQATSGMRPATLKELLAFGETYPDVQKNLPVLALGSSVDLMVNTYRHENPTGSMPFIVVDRKVKRLYPFLAGGFAMRVAGLEWLHDPAGYGMYHALFVKPR